MLGNSAEADVGLSANPAFAHVVSCLLSMIVAFAIWCLARSSMAVLSQELLLGGRLDCSQFWMRIKVAA